MFRVAIFIVLVFGNSQLRNPKAQLQFGFYSESCPSAEGLVRQVVTEEMTKNRRTAAILLRLQFHDCFVEGCDASVLLKGADDESLAPGNAGVGGFNTIDRAKEAVEKSCPGVVSCADIVALAARDSVFLAHGPFFDVVTGRRDGLVGNAKNAENLPDPQEPLEVLRIKFRAKGLTDEDLVLLTAGAHTIGETACFFVTPRLDAADPSIAPTFFPVLRSRCPEDGDVAVKIPLDWDGESLFDTHIFANIRSGKAVLRSDAALYDDPTTKKTIDFYLNSTKSNFARDFGVALVKMGMIGVKSGTDGEIRRICNATN